MIQLVMYPELRLAPAVMPAPAAAPRFSARPVIVLVGCGAAKQTTACRAKEMYTGSLFRAAREYAERRGAEWRILSARYGLTHPERRIKPYNQKLWSGTERMHWGLIAASSLCYELKLGHAFDVEVFAGETYADPVCHFLEAWGVQCKQPLRKMPLGQRLAWFKAQREAEVSP